MLATLLVRSKVYTGEGKGGKWDKDIGVSCCCQYPSIHHSAASSRLCDTPPFLPLHWEYYLQPNSMNIPWHHQHHANVAHAAIYRGVLSCKCLFEIREHLFLCPRVCLHCPTGSTQTCTVYFSGAHPSGLLGRYIGRASFSSHPITSSPCSYSPFQLLSAHRPHCFNSPVLGLLGAPLAACNGSPATENGQLHFVTITKQHCITRSHLPLVQCRVTI